MELRIDETTINKEMQVEIGFTLIIKRATDIKQEIFGGPEKEGLGLHSFHPLVKQSLP